MLSSESASEPQRPLYFNAQGRETVDCIVVRLERVFDPTSRHLCSREIFSLTRVFPQE